MKLKKNFHNILNQKTLTQQITTHLVRTYSSKSHYVITTKIGTLEIVNQQNEKTGQENQRYGCHIVANWDTRTYLIHITHFFFWTMIYISFPLNSFYWSPSNQILICGTLPKPLLKVIIHQKRYRNKVAYSLLSTRISCFHTSEIQIYIFIYYLKSIDPIDVCVNTQGVYFHSQYI